MGVKLRSVNGFPIANAALRHSPITPDTIHPTAIKQRETMRGCFRFKTRELKVWTAMVTVKKPDDQVPIWFRTAKRNRI